MRENESYGSTGVGFMDGDYMPVSEMRLPVTDMGFQLGDMCYDAIHVHKGRFFRLKDHLDRWDHSIAERRYQSLGYRSRTGGRGSARLCRPRGPQGVDDHLRCDARLACDRAQRSAHLQEPLHGVGRTLP